MDIPNILLALVSQLVLGYYHYIFGAGFHLLQYVGKKKRLLYSCSFLMKSTASEEECRKYQALLFCVHAVL